MVCRYVCWGQMLLHPNDCPSVWHPVSGVWWYDAKACDKLLILNCD